MIQIGTTTLDFSDPLTLGLPLVRCWRWLS